MQLTWTLVPVPTSALAFKTTLKQKLLSEAAARFVKALLKLTNAELLRALRGRLSQQKQVINQDHSPVTHESSLNLSTKTQRPWRGKKFIKA